MEFPSHIQQKGMSIFHLEALNAVVAMRVWAPQFANQLFHLLSDNSTDVVIFQAEKGKDPFLQACTKEIWLTCAAWNITLAVGHVAGVTLTSTADDLSQWHLGQAFKDKVDVLLRENNITCITIPAELFHVSNDF